MAEGSATGEAMEASDSASRRPGRIAWAAFGRASLVRLFFGSQIVVALALLILEVPRFEGSIELLVLLLILTIVAELAPIPMYGDSYVSVGFVLTMAFMVLIGPAGVVLGAPVEAAAARIGRRRFDYKALTNGVRFILVYWLSAKAFELVSDPGPEHMDAATFVGAALATFICLTLSLLFIAASSSLRSGERASTVFADHLWLYPHYAVLGILGLALSAAYVSLGTIGVLAFLTPALMIRMAMKQYVAKTAANIQKLKLQNTSLEKANVEVRRVSDELRESYDGTLEALVNALDARDQETKGHSIRVSHYMMDIARELGIKEGTRQWTDMQRGSLLHDVGKIGITDGILLKPGKLTDDEWTVMRKHPEIGYNMLQQVSFLQGAAEIILGHHERWDGKGYPNALHEDEIPLGARIFPVVDTFDSMTSDRPYRKAKSTLDALNEIVRFSGSQFDPLVVEAFLDIYETWVKGREGLHAMSAKRAA